MSFFKELFSYLVSQRKWFLIPIVIIFALVGGIFVLTRGTVIAPFIYTLF